MSLPPAPALVLLESLDVALGGSVGGNVGEELLEVQALEVILRAAAGGESDHVGEFDDGALGLVGGVAGEVFGLGDGASGQAAG